MPTGHSSQNKVKERLGAILPGMRPYPPYHLRHDMQVEWEKIVGRMPVGSFTVEMLPILEELCRVVCYCRDLTVWLDTVDLDKIGVDEKYTKKYNLISAKYNTMVRLITSTSVHLRLTASSQTASVKANLMRGTDPTSAEKPWNSNDPDSDGDDASAAA